MQALIEVLIEYLSAAFMKIIFYNEEVLIPVEMKKSDDIDRIASPFDEVLMRMIKPFCVRLKVTED